MMFLSSLQIGSRYLYHSRIAKQSGTSQNESIAAIKDGLKASDTDWPKQSHESMLVRSPTYLDNLVN